MDELPANIENEAATIARESRKPFEINLDQIAVPDGWELVDTEFLQAVPRRKNARIKLDDADSLIEYLKRHGNPLTTTIWCNADYAMGEVAYTVILNDHEEDTDGQQWRDHIAKFSPKTSVEWKRWIGSNEKPMDQLAFANFIEKNLQDIASAEGYPTGTAMLQMATTLEIAQDSMIKSAIRLQSGGIRMEYIEDDNAQTVRSMEVFNRFAIGIPVFWGGTAYQLEAQLKYRLANGKVSFRYELIRPDKVLEDAARTISETIAETGYPLFHGNPFA